MVKVRRFAFIHYKGFSKANQNFLGALLEKMPDYQAEVFDAAVVIKKFDLRAILHCLWIYRLQILRNPAKLKWYYVRTPYMFHKTQKHIRRRFSDNTFHFTIQTQSLFDGSIPGIPHFVYTDHTHLENVRYPDFKKSDLAHEDWIALEGEVYQNARINFTMSRNISDSMIKDYGIEKENVIPVGCGANVEIKKEQAIQTDKYDRKTILFVGMDWERKGGPILVKAFEKVLASHPDARLVIAGCSPEVPLKNCEVLGRISLEQVAKCYQSASLFCMPSRREPFGFVFLEAMGNSLGVIGSRLGAMPDFIHEGKNGLLIEPDRSDLLGEHLVSLLDQPEKLRSFGNYSHRLYWNTYGWANTASRVKEHIERCIT